MPKGHPSEKSGPQRPSTHSKAELLVSLNFKVPAKFRREFKIYATQSGRTMKELLLEAFQALRERDRRK